LVISLGGTKAHFEGKIPEVYNNECVLVTTRIERMLIKQI